MASPTGSCSSLWILEKLMDIPNQPPGGTIRPDEKYVLCFEDDGETLVVLREPRNHSLQSSREELSTSVATTPETFTSMGSSQNASTPADSLFLPKARGYSDPSSFMSSPVDSQISSFSNARRSTADSLPPSLHQNSLSGPSGSDRESEDLESSLDGRRHYRKRGTSGTPLTSPEEERKGATLPLDRRGATLPLERVPGRGRASNKQEKRQSLPTIFGRWARNLSFRRKSRSKRNLQPSDTSKLDRKTDEINKEGEVPDSINSDCVMSDDSSTLNLPSASKECLGKCDKCGKPLYKRTVESAPTVPVKHGAAARMSQWWLDQQSPHLSPKFATLDTVRQDHRSDSFDVHCQKYDPRFTKQLRQSRSKRYSLPALSPKPKTYQRPKSFHGNFSTCSCQSYSAKESSSNILLKPLDNQRSRPVSWAAGQRVSYISDSSYCGSISSTPSVDTLQGTVCANTKTEGTPVISQSSKHLIHQSTNANKKPKKVCSALNESNSSLSLSDQSQTGEVFDEWACQDSGRAVEGSRKPDGKKAMMDPTRAPRSMNQEELSQSKLASKTTEPTSQSKAACQETDEKPTDQWILPPQELCQKLQQVQQERLVNPRGSSRPGARSFESPEQEAPFSDDAGLSDAKMRDPRPGPVEIPCLVTGVRQFGEVNVGAALTHVTATMEKTYQSVQETDIDILSKVSDHDQLKKQLEVANRIIDGSESVEGQHEENNNNRKGKRTPTEDDDYLPVRHTRKPSLVLALEDGQLDMEDVAVRSLDIESDINVIAQLNQLNQRLDELNNYHHLAWEAVSPTPKPRLTKSHSIASSTGAVAETLGFFTNNLRRSGSESHMLKRHKVPLDIRPSSALGRTSSGSKLTRQRSRDRIHSSPEESPRTTPPGRGSREATPPSNSRGTTPPGGGSPTCSSPQKRPWIKPLLRLHGEGGLSDSCSENPSSPKPSSPTFVARLKNKLLSPKIPLKFPNKASSSNTKSETRQDRTQVALRKSPGHKGDSSRLTWPFFPPKWSQDESREQEGPDQPVKLRKIGTVQLGEEQMLPPLTNDELQDTGSSDSGMEKDWNSKSNDDLVTSEIIQEGSTEPLIMAASTLPRSPPQSLYSRPYNYPSSAPMTPYRTPSSGSQEDILDGKHLRQSLPMSAEFRSADNLIDDQRTDRGSGRPPKPKHRPKRRSRPDLPAEFKAILAELKESSTTESSCEVPRRRKSLTPQRRPTSAYGKLGQSSMEGTPEKSPTSPLMKLEQRRSCSFDTLQLVAESETTPKLPRSRSLTTLNETAAALPPSSINRTLSLPAGLWEEGEQMRCPTSRYRKIHVKSRGRLSECFDQDNIPVFAEAIWDHVSMDESELVFQVGDVIEITDTTDCNWWWGHIGSKEGWLPAACVRLRVGQGETIEDCIERLSQKATHNVSRRNNIERPSKGNMRKISLNLLSNDQVRANVIREILTTEKDYVKLLGDICKGFICQAKNKDDLFSKQQLSVIFGNIEDIYSFHQVFLASIEECIDAEMPHLSQIGECFLKNRTNFQLYSDYCNNYPLALSELKGLYKKPRIQHFLEECRIQQDMIKITLDGFLLTPVQKICKYPLQLNELLKYTKQTHKDYGSLREAFHMMRETALDINEKKRRVENIQKIAHWQRTIADWEGEDLLKRSSKLIHSGEAHRMTKAGKFVLRRLFLFEHQLIVCKKDILRRNGFVFKGRFEMKDFTASSLDESRDIPAFSWRLSNDKDESLSMTFTSRNKAERVGWMEAFSEERRLVAHQKQTGESHMHRSYTTPLLKSEEETASKKSSRIFVVWGPRKKNDAHL